MTSRLVEIQQEEENGSGYRRYAWTGFKLVAGVAAVSSFFFLEQRLNEMGCRYAVNTAAPILGMGLVATGRELLDHRFTAYALDMGYLLALAFILVSSLQGLNDLENGGCTEYFEENTDTEITSQTRFMNETEYKEWKKQKSTFKRGKLETEYNGK